MAPAQSPSRDESPGLASGLGEVPRMGVDSPVMRALAFGPDLKSAGRPWSPKTSTWPAVPIAGGRCLLAGRGTHAGPLSHLCTTADRMQL